MKLHERLCMLTISWRSGCWKSEVAVASGHTTRAPCSSRGEDGRCLANLARLGSSASARSRHETSSIHRATVQRRHCVHFRRFIAVMLLLAFGATVAEAGMPDVHDGDATHSELQRYDAVVAHSDAAPSVPDRHPDEPMSSGHAQHSCHCAHAHFGWRDVAVVMWPAVFEVATSAGGRSDAPTSAVRSPHLRPPIA